MYLHVVTEDAIGDSNLDASVPAVIIDSSPHTPSLV